MRERALSLAFVLMPCVLMDATELTKTELEQMVKDQGWKRASVHDPSIVVSNGTNGEKTYYVFGSHMGEAKTQDLRNWSNLQKENDKASRLWCDVDGNVCSFEDAFKTNKVRKVKWLNGVTATWGDNGNFDITAYQGAVDNFKIDGNMWAPDVIYNTAMKKWCYYLSLNGSKWNSAIVLLTSDSVEGPYQYQGPVVFSGFNVTSSAATDYTKTDMAQALGTQRSLPARYNVGDKWGTYWPHAIDPGVFYDESGELWMNYGSWSGGIYVLRLDKNTGLRDYTYKYESDYDQKGASVTSDPYFGKKIAGGYYVSGEGSYIEKIGEYYYLFMSYGFYSPEGGYEMRVFRSENPDGPYTDMNKESAIYTKYQMNYGKKAATNRGMKLMGGYQWKGMNVAEIAQGHNSALMDSDGKAYVVYHTKFNNGTAGHELRVHQLYVNRDGWITAAPYQYNQLNDVATAEGVAGRRYVADSDIVGTYELVAHKYNVDYENYEYSTPSVINLTADGKITGDYAGTYTVDSENSYVTLALNGVDYRGVVVPGTEEGSNIPAVCITAMNVSSGVNVWAVKRSGKYKLAQDYAETGKTVPDGGNVYTDLDLSPQTTQNGTKVKWSSGNSSVITNTGTVIMPDEDTPVTLTLEMTNGEYEYTGEVNVTVKAGGFAGTDIANGIVAYYDFDNNLVNRYATNQTGTAKAQAQGKKPTCEADKERGTVLRQYFGYNDAKTISYVSFPNPLKGQTLSGATVSAWVKRGDHDAWDALWSFCTGVQDNVEARLYLTGNDYLGYNDGNGNWFDHNHPDAQSLSNIPVEEWTLVTYTFTTDGFTLYINGKKAGDQQTGSMNAGGNATYNDVLSLLSNADNFYLGYGSFWGSAPASFDDLLIYNRALGEADVAWLFYAANAGESFMPGEMEQNPATRCANTEAEARQVLVWPVPATDVVNVKITAREEQEVALELKNTAGQVLMARTAQLEGGQNVLKMRLPAVAGIYVLSVAGQNIKLVKE